MWHGVPLARGDSTDPWKFINLLRVLRNVGKIAPNHYCWRMLCYIFVVRPAHLGVRVIFVWRNFLAGRDG